MSKKVIEQEKEYSLILCDFDDVLMLSTSQDSTVFIEIQKATEVAKAIDPEYQKVIDQNAKLVEALEEITVQKIIDIMTENYNIFYGTNEADICSANDIVSLIKQSINQNKL